jgi:hypothetical protein
MKGKPPSHAPAVALVVTLMMMAVLVMMVVGLAGVMRIEHGAARNLTYQVVAEQLAEVAVRQAMTAVLTSTPAAGVPSATGPGWIQAGGRTLALVSPATPDSQWDEDTKNLERIGTNSLILDTGSGFGGVFAGWVDVVSPPVAPENRTNLVGRFAWWVDDEGTKLNLNAVGSNITVAGNDNTNAFLPLATRYLSGNTNPTQIQTHPFTADWVFANAGGATNVANSSQSQALQTRTRWLPTPESLKSTNFLPVTASDSLSEWEFHAIKGRVTTWSSNTDLTLWGSNKVNLAELRQTVIDPDTRDDAYNRIRAALKTNALNVFFGTDAQGYPRSLARKFGGGGTNAGDPGNHGDLVLDQIAANILAAAITPTNANQLVCTSFAPALGNVETNRFRNGLPMTVASDHLGPYLSEVRVRVDGAISNRFQVTGLNTNILQSRGQVRLGLMVRLTNPYNMPITGGTNYAVVIQPRKFRFKILQDNPSFYNPPLPVPGDGNRPTLGQVEESNAPSLTELGPTGVNTNTLNGWWGGPEWFENTVRPWPLGATFSNRPANLSAPMLFSKTITFSMPGVPSAVPSRNAAGGISEAYVQLDQIVLKKIVTTGSGPDATTSEQIVDWISMDDLAQGGNFYNTGVAEDSGQINFSALSGIPPVSVYTNSQAAVSTNFPALAESLFTSDATSQGIRKTDPRVRFTVAHWETTATNTNSPPPRGVLKGGGWPSTVKAWTRETDVGLIRSNTGITYLAADPSTNVNDHHHFLPGYHPTNGIQSVAQLGSIHTGLPWRTLRFQATPAGEVNQGPPDWVVLEAFTATNPSVSLPRINLNGLVTSLLSNSTASGAPVTSTGQRQIRRWVPLAALGALRTNFPTSSTNVLASNGIPVSLASPGVGLDETRLREIGSGLTNALINPGSTDGWSADSGWHTTRGAQSSNFPAFGMALAGEFLEVRGVADDNPGTYGEDVVEGRLRAFLDVVTTRSDTFSVWSVGQGLVVVTNASGNPIRTNVMGEVRKQTVFQREPILTDGVVTGYRLRTLYTRNHVIDED